MAIVQISRITNRKGLTENLPQLAGAEFGWCIDSRRLFIGNGTLQEGAPIIGNTEILTEFSDIVATASYTYKDSVVGYSAQTGPSPSDPVIRTVQAKLDDFADVRDFGAVGDGETDDTQAINRALFQLYCVQTNTEIRRTLFFPAGTYKVTGSVVIPTYAKLVGEGADCSIILLDITSPSPYVARFGDSLQQTGVNIGNNGATAPRNIEISSLTFQSVPVTDIFSIESATQCYFDSVNFRGPLTQSSIIEDLATDDIAGVRFSSALDQVCNQITFDKCRFSGLTYGINTNDQLESVTVSNSNLNTLYQGIVLGEGVVVNGGPTGFRALGNMFDLIYAEAIIYDDVNLNASAYNIFLDVGNEYTGSAQHPIIKFGNDMNVSISDMFERSDGDANNFARIEILGGTGSGGSQIQLGRYARLNGVTYVMDDNQSVPQTIFVWNITRSKSFTVNYSIERGSIFRQGSMSVVAFSADDSVGSLSYTDDFNENANAGITLLATQVGMNILFQYTSTDFGDSNGGTLTYSINHLA